MIIQHMNRQVQITKFPLYFGTLAASDEIVGVGQDSVFVIDDSLQMITYQVALQTGTIAEINIRRRPSSLGYSETLRHLHALAGTEEGDDLGRIRPSGSAIEAASRVTFNMLRSATGLEPPSDVSTDRDGDIRIIWESGNRTLELVCPFEQSHRPYIYYADGTQYEIAYDLSVYRLGRLLKWLAGASSAFPR